MSQRALVLELKDRRRPAQTARGEFRAAVRKNSVEKNSRETDCRGDIAAEDLPGSLQRFRGKYQYQGVAYCSSYEAAAALLLRRYVPGFRIEPGVTYQVPVARNHRGAVQSIDFLIKRSIFIEYHELLTGQGGRKHGDFLNRHQKAAYRKILSSSVLNRKEKNEFKLLAQEALKQNYRAKRQELLLRNQRYRKMRLIVATSPQELYNLVLLPFSTFQNSEAEFLSEFDQLKQAVLEANPEAHRRQSSGRSRRRRWAVG